MAWFYYPTGDVLVEIVNGAWTGNVNADTSQPYEGVVQQLPNQAAPGATAPTDGAGQPGQSPNPDTAEGTQVQQDAFALIQRRLQEIDPTGELANWAWEKILSGATPAQIDTELEEQPTYKRRFVAVERFKQEHPNLRPPSAAEVLELERAYAGLFAFYDLPQGMYNQPEDFADFIVNQRSPKEVSDALATNFTLSQEWAANPTVASTLGQLQQLYGWSPGNTLAMFLDPNKALPIIQQQIAVAQIGRAAARTEFGKLSRTEAERLQAEGVTEEQARAGFEFLGEAEELLAPLPGQEVAEETFGRQAQLEVVGGNAQERRRLRRQQERRKAQFAGGGGFATGREGLVGLGASS